MAKEYSKLARTHVRRADRAVTDEAWIIEFMKKAPLGILAMVSDGQPFINTNMFIYDEDKHAIFMHTAIVGRTRATIERENKVCFSVSEMGRLLPADVAKEFSVEYSGVSVFGKAVIMEDEVEIKYAAQLLLDKYFPHLTPGKDYRPTITEEIKQTTFFRIDIEEWVGKKKTVEEDFPGAFIYGDFPST